MLHYETPTATEGATYGTIPGLFVLLLLIPAQDVVNAWRVFKTFGSFRERL